MNLEYAAPTDENINDCFAVMYHEDCIDGIPEECRTASYFVNFVNYWKAGGEHVWVIRDDSELAVAVFRAELVGESDFMLHASALRRSRGVELLQMAEVAMSVVAHRHDSKIHFEALIKEGTGAVGFARALKMKFMQDEGDGYLLYEKEI